MHATYLRQPFSTLAIQQESSGELVKSIDCDPNTRQISSRLKRLHGGCPRSTGQNLGNRTNFPASLVAQLGVKISLSMQKQRCYPRSRRSHAPQGNQALCHSYGAHPLEPCSATREGITTSTQASHPGRSPDHNPGEAPITMEP